MPLFGKPQNIIEHPELISCARRPAGEHLYIDYTFCPKMLESLVEFLVKQLGIIVDFCQRSESVKFSSFTLE